MARARRGCARLCILGVNGGRKRRAAGIEARDQRAEIDRRLQLAPREPVCFAVALLNSCLGPTGPANRTCKSSNRRPSGPAA